MSGTILIPPCPNWFLCDTIDCRSEDGLMVTAAFKAIVVYHVNSEERLPKVLKMIPYQGKKVIVVRLHPSVADAEYGHSVASTGDGTLVKVHNIHTGDLTYEHNQHKDSTVNGLCWGSVNGEEVVVSVGGGGRMVVWQPKYGVTQAFTFKQFKELTLVEANPHDRSQALVAAERSMALVSLKDGRIQTLLQGHDYSIYCMRWYPKEGSPFSQEHFVTNSRAEAMMENGKRGAKPTEEPSGKESDKENWRRNQGSTESTGPFFASSDYGRNVLVWDLTAKKYVTKLNVPLSASGYKKQQGGKDKGSAKQHVPLAWHQGELLSSTIRGELLQWTLLLGSAKYKPLHHLHSRAVYTLNVLGNLAITTGLDRYFHGYNLVTSSHTFTLPVLGGFATSLSFCPQDVNRLAIGSQENCIRVLNFGSEVPVQTLTVSQNIKGKIYTLSWHPEIEGRLLFGSASGQVGFIDVSSGHMTSFAYYHQNAVYKVEWAPPVCPEKLDVRDSWCAYSFGDKKIVIRSPSDPLADPVRLRSLLPESERTKMPKDITEFSFSPDYKFLAVGALDGQVVVYRSADLALIVTVTVVRKSIQHLLWQPPSPTNPPYILAIGSNENKIYIFHLDSILNGEEMGQVLTQATGELCGHEARVVWLAWSPHKTGVLASASYDNTIQLWDTSTGEPIVNYGGHASRVFRVEFSPSDPDLMYSTADEICVHTWRPSLQTCKTASDSNAVLKEYNVKKEQAAILSEDSTPSQEAKEKKTGPTSNGDEGGGTGKSASGTGSNSSGDGSSKKVPLKSFFPKYHSVASRKKSFHRLVILNLLAKHIGGAGEQEAAKASEDDLEEELDVEDASEESATTTLQTIAEISEKYQCLLEEDAEMANPEDFNYILKLYGSLEQMDSLLADEIQFHEKRGSSVNAGLMHCWRGSLDEQVRSAARHKKLTPFLVAAAPQVSLKLWELACEAYAEQLVEEGDVITGATYLVNINKIKEAVDILTRHKHFREAYSVARCRLGYDEELRAKVVSKWVSCSIYDGNFDLAATLQMSLGSIEEAARTLSRRIDPSSLFVAAQLYQAAGRGELATAMGTGALKEAAIRQEMTRIESFLAHMPDLSWFRTIFSCHQVLLHLLRVNKQKTYSYMMKSDQNLEEQDCEESDSKLTRDTKKDSSVKSNDVSDGTGSEKESEGSLNNKPNELDSEKPDINNIEGNTEKDGIIGEGMSVENGEGVMADQQGVRQEWQSEWVAAMERVRQEWQARGITEEQHQDIYQTVIANFSTQQIPANLKQLWFLVSVALTECLLAPSPEACHRHLAAALQHTLTWGKIDQVLHLTHLLLPRGPQDLSTLGPAFKNQSDIASLPSVKTLCQLYHFSELSLLHSHVMNDEVWPEVQDTSASSKVISSVTANVTQELSKDYQPSITSEKVQEDVSSKMANLSISSTIPEENTTLCAKEVDPVTTVCSQDQENGNEIKADLDDIVMEEEKGSTNGVPPGKIFKLPRSKLDLLAALDTCLDSLSQESEHQMELSSGFSSTNKLSLDIVNKLKCKGTCSEVEILTLMSKISSMSSQSS